MMPGSKGGDQKSFHRPVLYHESLKYLQPQNGLRFIDGTLGAGGHAYGILDKSDTDSQLLGLDLDPQAIVIAKERLQPFGGRAIIQNRSYATMREAIEEIGWHCVHGIILDLGISSMQVDHAERGFAFSFPAPLDMRFDPTDGPTAADLLNSLDESEIADIIWSFGEEPLSRRIAKKIVAARPIYTTTELADIVKSAYRGKRTRTHPATRTFQSLRIAVNRELEVLEQGLTSALGSLCKGGRLAVITFHSLEDRKVKQFFKTESKDCLCPPEQIVCTCGHEAVIRLVTRKPIVPSQEEVENNPRARSAKLRVAEKI